MHEQHDSQAQPAREPLADAPIEPGARPPRAAALVVKLLVCVVSTLTLLGGARAFQQAKPAPAKDAKPAAQSQPNTNGGDRAGRPTSNPYTGSLSIFEDPKREEKLQIDRVMDLLKIREGSAVADIGAGSGWFSVRAARRVGSSGAVYAVDINRDYLNYIEERARKEGLPQVRTILGREDDPLLPARSTDAVLILKTYHEIAEPVRLMKNLRAALREGATVGIIDRNGRGDDHGLDQSVVVKELERAGYRLVESYDFVKPDGMDYFLVFVVKN
ncbi:MAG TPA: class I SAM-dependent methyltransferase [Pyrinomonadaceae bacterium]|nr:class I SAM-dependent methyltransferase [Pyrinomonadaceae bacterium]